MEDYTKARDVVETINSNMTALHDSSLNIYQKTGVTGTFRQLYVNDNWGVRARTPILSNSTNDADYYTATNASYPFTVNSSEIGSWANSGTAEFVWLSNWSQNRARISNYTINGSTATINFQSPESNDIVNHHNQSTTYYYDENAYALLDAPGEWFLDTSAHTLYYIPRRGEDMSTAQIIAPNVQQLISTTTRFVIK